MTYRLTIRDGVSPGRPGEIISESDNDELPDWEIGDWFTLPNGQVAAVLGLQVSGNGRPDVTLFVGRQP